MWGSEPEMASLSRLMIDAIPQPSDRFTGGGGLFLDPANAIPPSFVSLISPDRRRFAVRRLGFGGGGGRPFMSVSLSVKKRDGGDEEAAEEEEEGYDRDSGEFQGRNGNIAVKVNAKAKGKEKSSGAFNMTKHLWAGAISAMVSRTFVAPLERLKLEYIVRGEQRKLGELVGAIAASQGLLGFWKGNFVNILRTAPFKAINFYAYDTYRDRLMKISGRDETTNFERFLAGAAAGVTATVLCIPMDTIRTVMVAPGGEALGGLVGTFQHMIRTEGFLSLYKGLGPSIVSMAPSGAVFYGVYDVLKSAYLRSPEGRRRSEGIAESETGELSAFEQLELGPVRTLVYGAVAGLCAEAATYPFEVVRRQLQMQSGPAKMTALSTCCKIIDRGGVPALYAGLLPSLLQVLPSAAISYFVYEFMKIVLKVESA